MTRPEETHRWSGDGLPPDVDAGRCSTCGLTASSSAIAQSRVPVCDPGNPLHGAFIAVGFPGQWLRAAA